MSGPFADFAAAYREKGFWPRPIQAGSKACKIRGWQRPDAEIAQAELNRWDEEYGHQGIALLMGNPLPDGTRLGALDIDRDEYVCMGEVLAINSPCWRVGKKGGAFFVRIAGDIKNASFKVKGLNGAPAQLTAEILFLRKLCVIPPTIHPDTNLPYRWVGPSLLDVDLSSLPLIEG